MLKEVTAETGSMGRSWPGKRVHVLKFRGNAGSFLETEVVSYKWGIEYIAESDEVGGKQEPEHKGLQKPF